MDLLILIGVLGIFTGFISGMLGIGGGIIMAPLLLYVPGWFGFSPLSMKVVAGLTIVQGLLACFSGALTHRKFHFVSSKLTLWMGITIFLTALIGGATAQHVPNNLLLIVKLKFSLKFPLIKSFLSRIPKLLTTMSLILLLMTL